MLSPPALADQVRSLLEVDNDQLRTEAIKTLARWRLYDVDQLIEVLHHGGHNERLEASRDLKRIGNDSGLHEVAAREGAY